MKLFKQMNPHYRNIIRISLKIILLLFLISNIIYYDIYEKVTIGLSYTDIILGIVNNFILYWLISAFTDAIFDYKSIVDYKVILYIICLYMTYYIPFTQGLISKIKPNNITEIILNSFPNGLFLYYVSAIAFIMYDWRYLFTYINISKKVIRINDISYWFLVIFILIIIIYSVLSIITYYNLTEEDKKLINDDNYLAGPFSIFKNYNLSNADIHLVISYILLFSSSLFLLYNLIKGKFSSDNPYLLRF